MILERIILTTATTAPHKAPELSIDYNALALGLRVISSSMSANNKAAAFRIITENFRDQTWGTYTSGVVDILLKILAMIDSNGDRMVPHAAARFIVEGMQRSMLEVLREAFVASQDEGHQRKLVPHPGVYGLEAFLACELGFIVADATYHFDDEPLASQPA